MKITAKKSLGQNFLTDEKIIDLIIKLGEISSNDFILEVGPGTGALTKKIIENQPKKLTVIEKDEVLARGLNLRFGDKLKVINEDMMQISYNNYFDKNLIIFGNLPYNISTQILAKWIKDYDLNKFCKRLILMFQKEVADRIIAKSNSKDYGRLSILSNWKLNIKKMFDIKPSSFSPRPEINSSVLLFKPKKNYFKLNDPKNLEKITRIFFMHRRKMIKKPYNQIFNGNTDIAKELGIKLNLRPQNIDFETYFKLTECFEKLRS